MALGWEIARGGPGARQVCAIAKAKQKNVPQETELEANTDKYRACLEMDRTKKHDGKEPPLWPFWRIMVHGVTGLKFSQFFQRRRTW